MKHLFLSVAIALSSVAGPAEAQSVKLTGKEIRDLLTGNTAAGRWEGQRYRQFFGPDGVTIYALEGARSTRGEWRVDDEAQEYQSIWPNDPDWEGWFVMEYAGAGLTSDKVMFQNELPFARLTCTGKWLPPIALGFSVNC